ncbi:MAG TPA: hypothetical protein VJN18_13425 [Polyangiaceae bacterium]|nr:hypothetical protein [Polyangiaceae bacterium]
MSLRLGWVCVACVLIGCGGKREPKAPTPATVDTAPQVVEDLPDLSPVARPAEVVAVGRLARPRLFVETLAKWSSLPLRLEDMMPKEARGLTSAVLWEAPMELVVALDNFGEGKVPPPLFVVSIGLKSLQQGLSAADTVQLPTRRLAPGVFRVGELKDGSCAIAASAGSSPARLVCGRSMKDVDVLLPYATRGRPREPASGADFEVTLDAKPVQDRFGGQITALRLLAGVAMREVALDSQRFDRAVSDAIYGGIDEAINLFGDLDQIRLEARLDAARRVLTTSAELRLKGSSSWVAGTLAATKSVPVPATLPRLPHGTGYAYYSAPLPAERYAAMSRILADLAEGYLEHEKLPEATRKRVRRALEPWFAKMPESFGFAVPSSQIGQDVSAKLRPDTGIVRFTEPSPRILAAYSELFGLLGDPGLFRWVQSKMKLDAKARPKIVRKPLKLAGFKVPAMVFEATLDLKAWSTASPAIVKALESALPTSGPDQSGPYIIVVQPDGPFTYVATGQDVVEIASVMAQHRKNEPGAFFARPARADLVTAVGFFTLAFVARSIERSGDVADVRKALTAAPHHGDTPLPFSSTVGPGSARVDLELPANFFADVTAMIISSSGKLKGVLEKRPLQ